MNIQSWLRRAAIVLATLCYPLMGCVNDRSTLTHRNYVLHSADYTGLSSCFIRQVQDDPDGGAIGPGDAVRVTNLSKPEEVRVAVVGTYSMENLFWEADLINQGDHIMLTVIMRDIRWDWNMNRLIVSKLKSCGAEVDGFHYEV